MITDLISNGFELIVVVPKATTFSIELTIMQWFYDITKNHMIYIFQTLCVNSINKQENDYKQNTIVQCWILGRSGPLSNPVNFHWKNKGKRMQSDTQYAINALLFLSYMKMKTKTAIIA